MPDKDVDLCDFFSGARACCNAYRVGPNPNKLAKLLLTTQPSKRGGQGEKGAKAPGDPS